MEVSQSDPGSGNDPAPTADASMRAQCVLDPAARNSHAI